MTTITDQPDLSTVPGAMQDLKIRELEDGSKIEFQFAPYGWLAKNGEPRRKDWRAYYYETASGDRKRLESVTTLLDRIMPKGGLPPWAEARGIQGTVEAVRRGLLDPADMATDAVRVVRDNRLGADRARDDAADRGLNVHALLEEYMLTGKAPSLADHRIEHHGYITGLSRFLLDKNPEPVAIEQLVADPEAGYAGRMDLLARVGGLLGVYDAKTQEKGRIYEAAHLQCGMYTRAHVACGGEEPFFQRVVVFAADGTYREMDSGCTPELVNAALAYARLLKPVASTCESENRRVRAAA